jgi:hypothetical protein
MNEPRKPIFGFLWPKPDPNAPVDGAYRQERLVRVAPRGPIRVAVLLVGTILTTAATGAIVMAGLTTRLSPATVIGAAVSACAIFLVLRGWVVGTFVTDRAVTIESTWRREVIPWSSVRSIEFRSQRAPLVGLPLPVRADRSVLVLDDGRPVATHVYSTSPDLWLRPEALDMARLRLERWASSA